MKKIFSKYCDHFLHLAIMLIIFGLSASLVLTSCAPVSQSVSKLKSTEESSNEPIITNTHDRERPVREPIMVMLKTSFYPLLISEDLSHQLPGNSIQVDSQNLTEIKQLGKTTLSLKNDRLKNAQKIYIMIVLNLSEKSTSNIETNHFIPFLHKIDDRNFELVFDNHVQDESIILERQRTEERVKDSLMEIYFYTEKDVKEDEIIKLTAIKDKPTLEKKKRSMTTYSKTKN